MKTQRSQKHLLNARALIGLMLLAILLGAITQIAGANPAIIFLRILSNLLN